MKTKFGIAKVMLMISSMLLLLVIVACSESEESSSSDSNSNGDVAKLTVWLWPGMGIEEQIEQYDEEHENVEVEIQLAEFADVHSNLTTSLAAGSGAPDISAVEVKGINKYIGNPQHFVNLFDLGAEEVADDYLDWKFKQAQTIDGEYLLGLPTDIGPQAMAYRTDVFEEAGLPTDREEVAELIQTWEDYIEVGKTIKEKTGKALIDDAGGLYTVVEGQGEKKYYDAEGNIIIESNEQIDYAYNLATEVIESGLESGFEQWSTEWGTGMTNGDFATLLAPAWMMGFMQENAPDASGKWDIAKLPGETSGNWGGSFLTIPEQSDHPEEAYELIKWLLSPEQQLVTFERNGNFPSTPEIYETDAIQNFKSEYFSGAPVGQIYAEAAKDVSEVLEGPDSITIEEVLKDAIIRVRDGQGSPEESWQQSIDELERTLGR
ncbi:ABC transporter substrate-binding protein [Aquibacillus albus]|uniref:Cellobiose transport system substrate-binding protein n=1 Tax=Aquibacillus albus TaxID=1168171 RepID=A0ABS2MXB4_9BACI|nr:extracellular solute-binding protein [Aquibacillus albus]MBM7570413.1 cellobiose transport system substrate-binding protein [Aquibacillus albus]